MTDEKDFSLMRPVRLIAKLGRCLEKQPPAGFTLLELLIVLVVVSVLATIAAPSFLSVVENNRVVSAANSIQGAVQYARSEAVRRQSEVSLCVVGGADEGGWGDQLFVYVDGSCDSVPEAPSNDRVLRVIELDGRLDISGGPGELTFIVNGGLGPDVGRQQVIVSSPGGRADDREIEILASGFSTVFREGEE